MPKFGFEQDSNPDDRNKSTKIIEIRLYNLKPGTGGRYHKLPLDVAVPLLEKHDIKVLAFGPSKHDNDLIF